MRTNQLAFNKAPYWQFIRHLFELGADPSVTTTAFQFSRKSAEKIFSAYGEWGEEKKELKRLLKSEKTVLSERERTAGQIQMLESMDLDWQQALLAMCSFEDIVCRPVITRDVEHYKTLYERDYKALKQKLDQEAQLANAKKRTM
ncbi:hypothetical protein [Desulfobacter latus]|uniref:Uncharacterized protein n=1 Tax=Desulfobacter latus TaxID=2292 RepID=A0A850SZY7_9BACT|nr:hypothetical protein [Desulfobacter latus]NWH05670.1 hypothetical protein [Desulfobacter latus]